MTKRISRKAPKDRRDEILEEAAALFAKAGYAGTSISMIANAVGVSKAALFHHYKDKSEIYASIVTSVLEDMYVQAMNSVDQDAAAATQLGQFMTAHGRFIDMNFNAFRTAQSGFLGLTDPEAYRKALSWRDRYEAALRSILARGAETGEFDEGDVFISATAVLSCLNWMTRWYKPEGPRTAEDLASEFCTLILRGLSRRDDHPLDEGSAGIS